MKPATDWADLPYFLEVARTGSFRAAAEALRSTHATVARRVSALEQAYGVRLFDRSGEGMVLTQAGEDLVPLAEEAEESVISARRKLEGRDTRAAGTVHVSIPPALAYTILPGPLGAFSDAHPEIHLDVVVTNRFQDLTRREADVSIRMAFDVNEDVVGRRVVQCCKGIYASRRYIDENFAKAGPGGEGLFWIGWGETSDPPDWVGKSPFPTARMRHQIREGTMHLEMIRAHQGMSMLPGFVEVLYPDLVRMPGTELVPDRSIWILLHSDLRRTARVRLFVDFMVTQLQALKPILTASGLAERVEADDLS